VARELQVSEQIFQKYNQNLYPLRSDSNEGDFWRQKEPRACLQDPCE
jgi:hypothetical protein